jgi:hypothetical protein
LYLKLIKFKTNWNMLINNKKWPRKYYKSNFW